VAEHRRAENEPRGELADDRGEADALRQLGADARHEEQ
jgi:hypothetical protein